MRDSVLRISASKLVRQADVIICLITHHRLDADFVQQLGVCFANIKAQVGAACARALAMRALSCNKNGYRKFYARDRFPQNIEQPPQVLGDINGIFAPHVIGAAVAATMIARNQQVVWNDLSGKISEYATGFRYWSQSLVGLSGTGTKVQVSALLVRQATVLQSYLDMFYLTGIVLIALCWMPLLLKRPDPNAKPHMGH